MEYFSNMKFQLYNDTNYERKQSEFTIIITKQDAVFDIITFNKYDDEVVSLKWVV